MFFFLSKILSFLLSPFTYLFILLIWIFFCKNARQQKKLISITLIFVFVFGNSFLLEEFVRLWEPDISKAKSEHYDVGIILSGMIIYDAKNDISRFNSNADRLLQVLPKLKRKEIDQIIFTGGSGDLYHQENKEAELIKRYLESINWDVSNFSFETESRNTYENALFTKAVLSNKFPNFKDKKILLITSALHMKRSIACFEKQGIKVDYYCTNRSAGPRKFEFQHCFIPQGSIFSGWEHLGHEIVGYLVYKLTGKI